ncbi:universal stress protein [Luteimonas arsenica]|uniref:universal stress protein n=1 Tax=Luteimonas arsenica TaxID=1586242 RepID=UPI00105636F6|nr:universal stress protein [Luteimonas arsenica]
MQDIVWKPGAPRAILLATDLDGRCDRALDRAVALAREWQAKLVVLTVVEPPPAPPPRIGEVPEVQASPAALRAAARLRRDVGPAAEGLALELLVREGKVGDCIEAVARDTGCSLVVTGVAHDAFFGRHLLGSTVSWLARHGRLPLLVVRNRVHAPYARMLVASDFSDSSARALDVARALFPDVDATLFSAFEVPYLGLRDGDREGSIGQVHEATLQAARDFLCERGHEGLPMVAAHGDAAARLAEHATDTGADLVAVATHGRSALFHLVIGSVAREILDASPCDTLLVPEPRAREAAAG